MSIRIRNNEWLSKKDQAPTPRIRVHLVHLDPDPDLVHLDRDPFHFNPDLFRFYIVPDPERIHLDPDPDFVPNRK